MMLCEWSRGGKPCVLREGHEGDHAFVISTAALQRLMHPAREICAMRVWAFDSQEAKRDE